MEKKSIDEKETKKKMKINRGVRQQGYILSGSFI